MVQVNEEKLTALVKKIFLANGLPDEDASVISNALVAANVTGRASHGVLRTKAYVERIRLGGANCRPNIHLLSETATTALMDADNALGMIAADKAAKLTRKKAEEKASAQ